MKFRDTLVKGGNQASKFGGYTVVGVNAQLAFHFLMAIGGSVYKKTNNTIKTILCNYYYDIIYREI